MGFVVSFLAQDKTLRVHDKSSRGSLVSSLAQARSLLGLVPSTRAQLKPLRRFVKSLLAQDETLWGTKVFRGVEAIHVGNAALQVKVYVVPPVEGVVVSPSAMHCHRKVMEAVGRGLLVAVGVDLHRPEVRASAACLALVAFGSGCGISHEQVSCLLYTSDAADE